MKILHIDDNLSIIKAVKAILEFKGHEFHYATSGKIGIKLISENEFDLILLDISMPEYSGFDLLHDLLNHSKYTPIIVISAVSFTMGQINELNELEVSAILSKPVSMESLLVTIDKVISKETNQMIIN